MRRGWWDRIFRGKLNKNAPDGERGEGGHEVRVFPAFSNPEGMKASSSVNLSERLRVYRTNGINEYSDGSYK